MNVIFFWIGLISLLSSSVLALSVGRAQARAGALVLVGGLLISSCMVCVLQSLGVSQTAPMVDLASSLGMGVGLLYLALRYSSIWLAVAMMLEGVEFAVTGYFISGPAGAAMNYHTYLTALNVVDLLIVANLLVGTFLDWRSHRERRGHSDAHTDPALATLQTDRA